MVLGTTMIRNSFTFTIGGKKFKVQSIVLGSGRIPRLQLKKHTELNGNIDNSERAKWRIMILIELFNKIDKFENNELAEIVFKKIVEETCKLNIDQKNIQDYVKKFFLSNDSIKAIEIEISNFAAICDENNDCAIVEMIFRFFVPLKKYLKGTKLLYKQVCRLIWRYDLFKNSKQSLNAIKQVNLFRKEIEYTKLLYKERIDEDYESIDNIDDNTFHMVPNAFSKFAFIPHSAKFSRLIGKATCINHCST